MLVCLEVINTYVYNRCLSIAFASRPRRFIGGDAADSPVQTELPMQKIPFRNWSISYRRMGSGPALLFLHNGGTSHRIWAPVMERLAPRHDVIAVDLLGYGASSKPGHDYTMSVYVDLVQCVLDTLRLPQVTLVGNCMGSAIALHFAHRHPERVAALVLLNPLTRDTISRAKLAPVLSLQRHGPRIARTLFGQAARLRLPRWTAGTALAMQFGPLGRRAGLTKDTALRALHSSEGQLRSMLAVLDDIEAYEAIDRGALTEPMPPICTIWGQRNQILSAAAGRELNTKLRPRAEHMLPDCGHLAMMEMPDEVAAIVERFVHEHHAAGS